MGKIKVMEMIWSMGDGGAQRILLNYLEDLSSDQDIELKLYVFKNCDDSYCNNIIKKKYKDNVVYLGNPQIKIPILKKIINPIIAMITWNKAIKEFKPDIVHIHLSSLFKQVLFPVVLRKIPIRFATLHSNPLRYKGIELKFIRKAFQKYNFIPVCVTKEQYSIAKDYYGLKKYEIVYNGVDVEKIKNQIISKSEARKTYGIKANSYVIAGVGRLNKIKRFDILIDSFFLCLQKKSNCFLYIAGEGLEKENLLNQCIKLGIEDKVIFLGNIDDISSFYCAADVLAITSESESSSLVLIESQLCNLRSVISAGVPDESIITNKVRKMKANATISEWADALLEQEYKGKIIGTIENHEKHNVSNKMKKIYLRYWSEYLNEKK